MVRTAVHVTGDATVTCIVAHGENEIDHDIFNNPESGVINEIILPHKKS